MANSGDSTDTIDAIQMLESQHRAIDRLIERIGRGSDGRDVESQVIELADMLSVHALIEERHFYPAARTADTDTLLEESYDDHQRIKVLLLNRLDAQPGEEEFESQFEELQTLVAAHVSEEEQELFPRVRQILDVDQLMDLADEMTTAMVELEEQGPPHRLLAE